MFFFFLYASHHYLHVLSHSFPSRRSSHLSRTEVRLLSARSDASADDAVSGSGTADRARRHEGQPDPRRELGADRRCRQRCRELSARSGRTAALLARSAEHTSELQSLMRISYAVLCLKKKN